MVREVVDDTVIIWSFGRVIGLRLEGRNFLISEIDMREGSDEGDGSRSGKRLIVRRGDDHVLSLTRIAWWRSELGLARRWWRSWVVDDYDACITSWGRL